MPSIAITPTVARPASAHSASTSPNSSPSASLVAHDEARDRGVIGPLLRGDHAARDVLHARALDRPRGPHRTRPAIQQQRHHHRRLIGRAAVTVLAIGRIERATCPSRRRRRSRTTPGGPRAATPGRPAATRTTAHDHTPMKFCAMPAILLNPPDSRPFAQPHASPQEVARRPRTEKDGVIAFRGSEPCASPCFEGDQGAGRMPGRRKPPRSRSRAGPRTGQGPAARRRWRRRRRKELRRGAEARTDTFGVPRRCLARAEHDE